MTSIKLVVSGAKLRAEVDGILTSGAVGIPVAVEYDGAWDGLTKNLVCICGKWKPDGKAAAILDIGDGASVAPEVMIAEHHLYLGIEGYNADGTLVIPTNLADCGFICPGAGVNADPSADPALPVWGQLQRQIDELRTEGVGAAGEDGGFYMPAVSQLAANKMKVSFTASRAGMGAVADRIITLPAGTDGSDYILTDADKNEIAELAALKVPHVTTPEAPLFADGVSEMTDTGKVYVNLQTGTYWRYQEKPVTREVTVTENVEATSDNPYQDGTRLGSADDSYTTGATGYHITPLIDLTKYAGRTIQIHLEGCQYASTGTYANFIQCRIYGTDMAVLAPRPYTTDTDDGTVSNDIGLITNGITVTYHSGTSATMTIECPAGYASVSTEIGYIRFCGKGAVADSNIYVTYQNQETAVETAWFDSGVPYGPVVTDAEKQQIVNQVVSLIDADLLALVGTGEVSV